MRPLRWLTAPALALLLAGPVLGEVKITAPAKVEPYKFVRVGFSGVAVGPKTKVVWKVKGPAGVPDTLKDGSGLAFVGPPGSYDVSLRVIDFPGEVFEEAEATVVIGEPVPPTPPVPPPPADPLAAELQALFTADAGADKRTSLDRLASLYKLSGRTIDDTSLTTCGALQDKLHAAAGDLMPDDALQPLRKRVGKEVVAVLGTNADAPLTTDIRKGMKALASRLATVLGGLK